jgi:hypothetical protein
LVCHAEQLLLPLGRQNLLYCEAIYKLSSRKQRHGAMVFDVVEVEMME